MLTRELAASELFGIEKGTATGVDARSGKFSLAHRGTLFLDEIAEMPMELQPMLLRAIQEKKIVRVGGAKEENTDVRLICATNKNLIELMRQGKFREDLYYRISVAVIEMPPLREHPEDIPELLEHLYRRHGGSGPFPLKDDEMTVWKSCLWPGNIRQLENALINWLVDGNPPKQNDPAGMIRQTACCDDIDWNALIARHSFDQIKDRLFRTALSVCQNNVRKASAMLKIPSSTLWDYLQKNRNS